MKKKIKFISIDGMEKCGVTSAFRQLKRSLKEQAVDFIDFDGFFNEENVSKQEKIAEKQGSPLIIREKGILNCLYKQFRDGKGLRIVEEANSNLINKERHLNNRYGSVNFFIIPEDMGVIEEMIGAENIPGYYRSLFTLFRGIKGTNIAQGIDVIIIPLTYNDKILDIQKKIFKILKEQYSY